MNETANKEPAIKWYYKPVWVFVAILAAGPFALPIVWFSPALKRWHKVIITIALLIITVWMVKATVDIYQIVLKQMTELQKNLQ